MDDKEFKVCIRKIQKGDKDGLKQIYQAYAALIYTVVYDMIEQKEDAQDITSEFFIRLWDKADTYKEKKGHRAWLITIARNMSIDFLRKQKRELLVEELPEMEEKKEDFTAEVVENLSMKDAMKHLKPNEQEVLDLKIMGEFTFQEIADLLEKPLGTVSWLYRQGIEKLKRYHKAEQGV